MVLASSSSKEHANRPPAWDQPEELVALDRLRFQHLHRVIYAHRQRVENVESYYDVLETERQAEVMHARAEAMRISRAKRKEEAVDNLKRDNQRMVERLCVVMRESESRQHSLASKPSKPPGSAPAGSLNLSYRKKAARQIDQDNRILLDRLVRVRPTVSTREELESRYQVYSSLVNRHSRLRRPLHKTDIFRTPPPPIWQPKKSKRKALEARPRPGKYTGSGGSKDKEASVKIAEASRRKASTPEPLKSAKKAARTELEKVNQNVLHKINSVGEVSEGLPEVNSQEFESEESEKPGLRAETPEPVRNAKQVAHSQLEKVEQQVLGKIQSSGKPHEGEDNDNESENYEDSDFESDGDEHLKAKGKAKPSPAVEESEEYEDDYEADDADDYSDAFEADDSSHLSSPVLSPKKPAMPTTREADPSEEFENDFEAESDPGSGQSLGEPAKSDLGPTDGDGHRNSVPSIQSDGTGQLSGNDQIATGALLEHMTGVASDRSAKEASNEHITGVASDSEKARSDRSATGALNEHVTGVASDRVASEALSHHMTGVASDSEKARSDRAATGALNEHVTGVASDRVASEALSHHMTGVASDSEKARSDRAATGALNEHMTGVASDRSAKEASNEHITGVASDSEKARSYRAATGALNEHVTGVASDRVASEALSHHMTGVATDSEKARSDRAATGALNEHVAGVASDRVASEALSHHMTGVASDSEKARSDRAATGALNEHVTGVASDRVASEALSHHMTGVASESSANNTNQINETSEGNEANEVNDINEVIESGRDYSDFEASESHSPAKDGTRGTASTVGITGGANSSSVGIGGAASSVGIGGAAQPAAAKAKIDRGWSDDFEDFEADEDKGNLGNEAQEESGWDGEPLGASNLLDDGSPGGAGPLFGSNDDDSIREDSGESLNFNG